MFFLCLLLLSLKVSAQCPADSLDFTWNLTNNCQPVVFIPLVYFGTGPYTYKWDFGDNSKGADTKLMKPIHIYVDSLPGPKGYTVVLTVTDSKKSTCSVTQLITVQPSPILVLDSTYNLTSQFVHCIVQGSACELDVVNKSPFKNSHYTVDWGDGSSKFDSTGFPKLLKHSYSSSQQYVWTINTTNGCLSYNFFCGSNPAGGIGCPANRLACAGLQLDFPVDAKTLANPPGTTYAISFQDGSKDLVFDQSTLPPIISHVFKGNMACIALEVKMVATNPCGFTNSTCFPVNISTIPNPDIGFVRSTVHDCANLTKYTFKNATSPCCIKIDGSKDNGVFLTWTITPNTYKIIKGALDSTTFTCVFNNVDCYKVLMKVVYDNLNCRKCGDTSVSKDICLDSLPIAKAQASAYNNFTDCSLPLKVNFTNFSTNAKSYTWSVVTKTTNAFWSVDFANGTKKTDANPVLQFNQPDTFNITLNAINDCGVSPYQMQIVTKSPPVIKIDKPLSYCGPDSFNLHVDVNSVRISNVIPGTTYLWTITPTTGLKSSTSNSEYPTFAFTANHLKTYMLKVTMDNNNGCPVLSDSTMMGFTDKPNISVSSDTNNICKGDSVKITAVDNSINNGQNIIFRWYQSNPSGGLKDSIGIKVYVKPAVTTTYTVKGYVKNDTLCKDVLTLTVNVKPSPKIIVTPIDTTICSGQSVDLNVTGGVGYKWSPINSASSNVTVNPVNSTTYTVTATGANSCKTVVSSIVNTKPLPVVSFTSKSIEFINKDITFINTSVNANFYTWSFGDGSSSQDSIPVHKFAVPGSYFVTLTGTSDIGCNGEAVNKLKIIKSVPFIFKADSGCSPFSVSFINNSIDPELRYYWDFGYKNLKSTLANPGAITYISNIDAVFTVTCYLIYNSDTIKATARVHVFNKPQANFTLDPHCGCPILGVNITNHSQSGLLFTSKWDFGDGNTSFEPVNMPHATVQKENYYGKPVDSTFYIVTLTDSNKCGISIRKDTVTVFPDNIIVDFSVSKSVVCENEIIQFTNKSKFFNSLYWDFGDSSKSSDPNPTHKYDLAKVYTVKLTAYNQCLSCGGSTATGSSSHTMQITVSKLPNIDFSIDSKKLCQDLAVAFTSKTQDPLSDIHWDFGDPTSGALNSSNSVSPSHTYKNSGTYIVKFIGKSLSANPCIDTIRKPVTINVKPIASFSDSSACQNTDDQFINHSLYYDNCFWLFGDGDFSNNVNPKHSFKNHGDYIVELKVVNNFGCSDSAFSNVTIYQEPKADFSYVTLNDIKNNTMTVTFINNSSDTCQYYWDLGDGNNSKEKNLKYTYNNINSYVVRLTVTNMFNCTAQVEKTILPETPKYFFYVPNAFTPGSSTLNNTFVPVITFFSSFHMKIFNRWGELIYETSDNNSGWDGSFGGKPSPEGTYVYVIEVRDASPLAESHTYNGYVVLLRKK